MTPTPCKSCHAPIFYVQTENGKTMPIDAQPVADGNIIFIGQSAHVLKKDEPVAEDVRRYKSHFATCPNHAKHRSKGK